MTGADYSFGLLPRCTSGSNSHSSTSYNCSLKISAATNFLQNGTQSVQVLNNVSTILAVLQYEDTAYFYLGIPPSNTLSARDYTATTYGVQTECKLVSNECNLIALDGANTPFYCTDAFSGDVTQAQNGWVMAYFTDATMESNVTFSGIENPYYFGIAALVNPGAGASNFTAFPEIVGPIHGGVAFVLSCATTLYDIEYDSVEGTVSHFETTVSNDSVANIWQGVMAFTSGNVGLPNLLQASTLAVFSNSAQEVADKMALAYSRVALAVGSEVLVPQPALAAQEREIFLLRKFLLPHCSLWSWQTYFLWPWGSFWHSLRLHRLEAT
jgi:hypothetical protein